jgi:hypothetical protein
MLRPTGISGSEDSEATHESEIVLFGLVGSYETEFDLE